MTTRQPLRVLCGGGSSHREYSLLPIGCLGVIYDYQPHGYALFYSHLDYSRRQQTRLVLHKLWQK
jgi:hypothetical protein